MCLWILEIVLIQWQHIKGFLAPYSLWFNFIVWHTVHVMNKLLTYLLSCGKGYCPQLRQASFKTSWLWARWDEMKVSVDLSKCWYITFPEIVSSACGCWCIGNSKTAGARQGSRVLRRHRVSLGPRRGRLCDIGRSHRYAMPPGHNYVVILLSKRQGVGHAIVSMFRTVSGI
jgi:hypothetical protein